MKLYVWKLKSRKQKKQIDKAFENQEIYQNMSCSSPGRQKQAIQNKRANFKLSGKHEQKALVETLGKERPFLPLASVNKAQRTKQLSLYPSSGSVQGTGGWEREGQGSAFPAPAATASPACPDTLTSALHHKH